MSDLTVLATMLQYGDSFFPSGSVAFSWGLESLATEEKLSTAEDLERFIASQLRYRWGSCDRAIITTAYHAGDDLAAIQTADQLQDCMTLARELRDGSQRSGAAILSVHAQLGTPNAKAYRALVLAKQAPGHIAAVQGLIGRSVELTCEQTCLIAAHSFCVSLLSAAIRLSLIGHLDGQRILSRLRTTITQVLLESPLHLRYAYAYAPISEIASMRHEMQSDRLFSN